MSTTAAPKPSFVDEILPVRNPIRVFFSWEPIKAFMFLIFTFAMWVIVFSLVVALLAVGVSLTLSIVAAGLGLPILLVAFLSVHFICDLERFRVRAFTGFNIPNPYKRLPDGPFTEKAKAFITDGALWRDIVYTIVMLPVSVAEFVIAVVGVSIPLSLMATPLIIAVDGSGEFTGVWTIDTPIEVIPLAILGFLLLIPVGYVFTIIARAHGFLARWLIGPSDVEALTARVETLADTRSRMVGVSLDDRRHIERNIHDSTQPRLVSLAMNLGMAREKLESDPQQARTLIDNAHQEAKDVLAELRNLVRGLHPSILTDRGLEAAIPALAGQCTVPVKVDVDLVRRPNETVETTAYYIVAEALANVAKHSNATDAHVMVRQADGTLSIDIVDDGQGGAKRSPGSGLAGLQDRVAALDGTLEIDSPEGGPTRISAKVPCESS